MIPKSIENTIAHKSTTVIPLEHTAKPPKGKMKKKQIELSNGPLATGVMRPQNKTA